MSRTRSESAHRKVIEAALQLTAERGFDGTSMDAIAGLSGVSKATIYKHWSDKDALLLELLAEVNGLHSRPLFDSGDIRRDLIAVLCYRPREHDDLRERMTPHAMAYSLRHPAFGHAWRAMAMDPPRREIRRLLKLGIEKGELATDVDPDRTLTLLLGPMLYWHIFLRKSEEDPKRLGEYVVNTFWRAFGMEKAGEGRSGGRPESKVSGREAH